MTEESKFKPPASVSPEGLEALKHVMDIAVGGDMISASDCKKIMAIMHCNPAMRLTRVFKQLREIEKAFRDRDWLDKRMTSIMNDCATELEGIRNCAECSPFFMNGDYGEGGKKSA